MSRTEHFALIEIPESAQAIIDRLNAAGHEAYTVGGCVRDALLGVKPHDMDITTSALPDKTLELFSKPPFKAIPTGIAHGTVTVLSHGEPIEVTTFRVDGEYTDRRRPDSVSFTRSLTEDLARRDFTVNAMAYSHKVGIVDEFTGQTDLASGIIRAVGEPYKRFAEDALRILRALRFAATLELAAPTGKTVHFTIEPETARAARELAPSLTAVSRERITIELTKLLAGRNAETILREYREIFELILPGLSPDCARRVGNIHRLCIEFDKKPSASLLLSALAADDLHLRANHLLDALRLDNKTKSRAELIASKRKFPMQTELDARRLCADCAAVIREHTAALELARECVFASGSTRMLAYIDVIEREEVCVSVAQLALKGRELKVLGIKPELIGRIRQALLAEVIEDPTLNKPEELKKLLKGIPQ